MKQSSTFMYDQCLKTGHSSMHKTSKLMDKTVQHSGLIMLSLCKNDEISKEKLEIIVSPNTTIL